MNVLAGILVVVFAIVCAALGTAGHFVLAVVVCFYGIWLIYSAVPDYKPHRPEWKAFLDHTRKKEP